MTDEQSRVISHPHRRHGRLLAGPGTGKSSTVLRLAQRLLEEKRRVRLTTFTRAATSELLDKIAEEGHVVPEPTTLHSFALSILLRNPGLSGLPEPVRIPDDYERRELIHPDLARRLRELGFKANTIAVQRLEREMAARWESLDPGFVLLADLDPALRNAYVAAWQEHRRVFGYSLFAEMPLKTAELVTDHDDLDITKLEVLIVDEYQDLNRSEIGLTEALGARGISIVAVGDDDQSIYSWRMADPAGIRDFSDRFPNVVDYELTQSFRCARRILDIATSLIQQMKGRPTKTPPTPAAAAKDGVVEHLAFPDQDVEQAGVAAICAYLIENCGLLPNDIAVLVRGDYNSWWSSPVREAMVAIDLPATDVEAALLPLSERESRRAIALGRLAANLADDLAWWQLLRLTRGISNAFIAALYAEAAAYDQRFSERLRTIDDQAPVGASAQSTSVAIDLLAATTGAIQSLDLAGAAASSAGWADWLLETSAALGIALSDGFVSLARAVGEVTPQAAGLSHFLNQLEPVTKDIALKTEGVAIMTMARSKGLTFRAVVVMGVEDGVIPSPRADDIEEERRLLYVAMTRPREYLYLTMASRRTGPTARSGAPNVGAARSRSPFMSLLSLPPRDGVEYLTVLGEEEK